MKNLLKKLSVVCLGLVVALGLVACTGGQGGGQQGGNESTRVPVELSEYIQYTEADFEDYKAAIGDLSAYPELQAAVEEAYQAGVAAIQAADSIKAVQAKFEEAKAAVAACIPYAQGIQTFVGLSNAEKTEILGLLEAYAVRNGITGISLFEDGGYAMYNPRVKLGTEKYIVGYGFGILPEGDITADLESEENAAWKRYYHINNAADPGTANYLNDQGSEVADFYGYFGAGFYTTFMNDEKNGYDWTPELAKTMPEAVGGGNTSKVWRFQVRVGAEAKYSTNSQIASRAAYNNREVEAMDYLTPFILLLNQKNGLYRGQELAGSSGQGTIKGVKQFYEASANVESYEELVAKFNELVGIKVYEENGATYFQVEFTTPLDSFYAMYYITSSLYMPIPQSFIDLVGVQNYLGFNEDKTESPVDNSLSLGAYVLEQWDSNQQVVYKKNPNYVYAETKYAIPGIHMNIFPAMSNDNEANFKEFIAGNVDSTGIPQTKLEEYKNDPRTRTTTGSSNFKLNVNATDAETWEQLFGPNGTVTQTQPDKFWEVEPALSNPHFVKALSLSINRIQFADKRGSIPSVDYLSSNYMSDPINGISYSVTEAHKQAVAGLLRDTDGCGYNLELAREYFKLALAELEAANLYRAGTKENPTVITLEIAWMYPQHEETYHNEIKQYFEDAFNHESVHGGEYKLVCEFWVGNAWSDVYYNKLMLGQYDLGFGSISGNSLNPLDFLSVLSSDQSISGSFTLNWGTNTSDPDADVLVYNGARWSFDALWTAANNVAVVVDGVLVPAVSYEHVQTPNEDGTYTEVITISLNAEEIKDYTVQDVVLCWYAGKYKEVSVKEYATVEEVEGNYVVTVNVPADLVKEYAGDMGIDVIWGADLGVTQLSSQLFSVYGVYEAE